MAISTTHNLSPDLLERLQQSASAKGTSIEQEVRELLELRSERKRAALSRIRARHGTLPRVTSAEVSAWIEAGRQRHLP